MNKILKRLKNSYLKILNFRPRILSTILFIPFLYILGWILAKPIFLIDLDNQNISLIGTIITFLIFVISLPKWFELRWGSFNTWKLVGVNKFDKKQNLSFYFLKGLLFSFILLILILIPIFKNDSGNWLGDINNSIFISMVALGVIKFTS